MDFELSKDQRAFQELARDFARDRMAPHAAEWDRDGPAVRDRLPAEAER